MIQYFEVSELVVTVGLSVYVSPDSCYPSESIADC